MLAYFKGCDMMLFHIFNNQDARRAFGGSDFLELQFCQLKRGTDIRSIVSIDRIDKWRNSSLYMHGSDWEIFYKEYKDVFRNGTYNNLKCGEIDWCGINYYSPEQVEEMIIALEEKKPEDYTIVLEWLIKAKAYNGIYILGL